MLQCIEFSRKIGKIYRSFYGYCPNRTILYFLFVENTKYSANAPRTSVAKIRLLTSLGRSSKQGFKKTDRFQRMLFHLSVLRAAAVRRRKLLLRGRSVSSPVPPWLAHELLLLRRRLLRLRWASSSCCAHLSQPPRLLVSGVSCTWPCTREGTRYTPSRPSSRRSHRASYPPLDNLFLINQAPRHTMATRHGKLTSPLHTRLSAPKKISAVGRERAVASRPRLRRNLSSSPGREIVFAQGRDLVSRSEA